MKVFSFTVLSLRHVSVSVFLWWWNISVFLQPLCLCSCSVMKKWKTRQSHGGSFSLLWLHGGFVYRSHCQCLSPPAIPDKPCGLDLTFLISTLAVAVRLGDGDKHCSVQTDTEEMAKSWILTKESACFPERHMSTLKYARFLWLLKFRQNKVLVIQVII